MTIVLVDPTTLRHIEGFSARRVNWLREKILAEKRWTRPLAIEGTHDLVLDGQHRMEVALALGLKRVPAVRFRYADVEVWSLRPKYTFVWTDVVARALAGDPFPYKTVKHRFPVPLPECDCSLEELEQ